MTDHYVDPEGVERLMFVVWARTIPESRSPHVLWKAVGAFPNEYSATVFSRRYRQAIVSDLRAGQPPRNYIPPIVRGA